MLEAGGRLPEDDYYSKRSRNGTGQGLRRGLKEALLIWDGLHVVLGRVQDAQERTLLRAKGADMVAMRASSEAVATWTTKVETAEVNT